MKKIVTGMIALGCSVVLGACALPLSNPTPRADISTPPLSYSVTNIVTMPDRLFMQGVEFDGDDLLVGTGLYGDSEIFRYPGWRTDAVLPPKENVQKLDDTYFGEGITRMDNGDVWQLTWKEGVAFKRDGETLEEVERVTYQGEGWGMCSFDNTVYVSDGSDELSVRDGETFDERSRVAVREGDFGVGQLNELECVTYDDGTRRILANTYNTDLIYSIDPDTGAVDGYLDCEPLTAYVHSQAGGIGVLNGIAVYPDDPTKLLLTGKNWPIGFVVTMKPAQA